MTAPWDDRKFFSIVTVVRNDAPGFERTALSIRAQTCSDYEWIVIDGGSSDGTVDCIHGNIDIISSWLSEPDNGIYDGMNKGLRRAVASYVVFLNAGDIFADENVLERVQSELKAAPCDVLFGSSQLDFGGFRVRRKARAPCYIWHGQPGLHQSTFFRCKKHLEFEYDGSYRICGDYDVITRMYAAGLEFRSTQLLVSVNEFSAASASGRRKLLLIREAARAQRQNLKSPLFTVLASVGFRCLTSLSAKVLTQLRLRPAVDTDSRN